MTYEEKIIWHEVITRPPTEEEKEYYSEADVAFDYVFDCEMPEDGQEILIASKWGTDKDICVIDEEGYWLECCDGWDGIIAWADMPKYKAGGQG